MGDISDTSIINLISENCINGVPSGEVGHILGGGGHCT